MSFLELTDKNFLITGVANRKSIAYQVAKKLREEGARLFFTVQNEEIKEKMQSSFPDDIFYILNTENKEDFADLSNEFENNKIKLNGMLHSMAFANYSEVRPFHETSWEDYLQADKISHFSLLLLSNTLKKYFDTDASVVTISISNLRATSYGYMGPIKATLEASVAYLAKSFSSFSKMRFNAVCAGPLKTSASAGIPNYIDNYLFAEQLTLRKEALKTDEVANTILFLLSSKSSGINATGLLVDAGMSCNYFDEAVVKSVANNLET